MASFVPKTGRQWRTGEPGILWSMESQSVGHDLAAEQQLVPDFLELIKGMPNVV